MCLGISAPESGTSLSSLRFKRETDGFPGRQNEPFSRDRRTVGNGKLTFTISNSKPLQNRFRKTAMNNCISRVISSFLDLGELVLFLMLRPRRRDESFLLCVNYSLHLSMGTVRALPI